MSAMDRSRHGPVSAATFQVEIDGVGTADFSACRGLGGSSRHLAVHEGGHPGVRLFPDDFHWEPLLLERGLVSDPALWTWFREGEARDGRIAILAGDGTVVGRWSFQRGRVARWRTSDLDASVAAVAIESIEIVHEGVQWEAT